MRNYQSSRPVAVTQDDLLYRFRLRVFAIATELGNVPATGRAMGIHPSTRLPLEAAAGPPRPGDPAAPERRPPRVANATSALVEQRAIAFALGHPGFGPARTAAEHGPHDLRHTVATWLEDAGVPCG
jgi:hypothetical protein